MCSKWTSPLLRQCFVTTGVSINYMTHGLVMGFTSVLLPALKESTEIPINADSASWIASIFGISLILGTLTVPLIMNKFGRKYINIFSAGLMSTSWIIIYIATSTGTLLLGRFLQGISMGFLAILGSVLIGEYSSPKNRGALLATISLFILMGCAISHFLGTFLSWRMLSVIFAIISFVDLVIILYSPESPSFLATRGRYDECRITFHWLRGHGEEEELEKLIKTDMAIKQSKVVNVDRGILSRFTRMLAYIKITIIKKEVYKPIIITMHLYALNQWAGAIMFDAYTKDILPVVVGKEVSFTLVLVSLDAQRIISSIIGIITVKNLRRRLVFAITTSVNIFGFLSMALYVYLKTHSLLSFYHPFIGIVLLHIHLFSQSAGTITLSNLIPGEIFPLEHRGLCGMFGIVFFSINETINMKTVPYLLSSIGLYGAYIVYAGLVTYFFTVTWLMLPETKDRPLLDIEEEFRGKPLLAEIDLVENEKESEKQKIFDPNA